MEKKCSLHFYMQSNWKIKVCAKNNILINKAWWGKREVTLFWHFSDILLFLSNKWKHIWFCLILAQILQLWLCTLKWKDEDVLLEKEEKNQYLRNRFFVFFKVTLFLFSGFFLSFSAALLVRIHIFFTFHIFRSCGTFLSSRNVKYIISGANHSTLLYTVRDCPPSSLGFPINIPW